MKKQIDFSAAATEACCSGGYKPLTAEMGGIAGDVTTSFRIGAGENDFVHVEDLLMKLALAETVMKNMAEYITAVEMNGGSLPDIDMYAPDDWAVSGMFQNIGEVSRALKCGCWGYKEAFRH